MEVVGGSIPLATTNSPTRPTGLTRRPGIRESRTLRGLKSPGGRMLKFLGSTIGIIFLIGLVVVILLLKFIF
jgi:hypothetical protein